MGEFVRHNAGDLLLDLQRGRALLVEEEHLVGSRVKG